MISKPTPVAKKKPRKGSQPKQHAANASSSDSSSDSNESLKNHQKILGKEVKHQALINMKTDKNKEVYEQASTRYLNNVPPGIGSLQNSQKYMETKRAIGAGPLPAKRLTPAE